jgi:hypothetical protein
MNTMILVLVLAISLAAVLAAVAFYRGSFRLAPVPQKTRGQFVLMLKKDPKREEEKQALLVSKNVRRDAQDNNAAPPSVNG